MIAGGATPFLESPEKTMMFDLALESGIDSLYYAGYRTFYGAGNDQTSRFNSCLSCTALYVLTARFRNHPEHGQDGVPNEAAPQTYLEVGIMPIVGEMNDRKCECNECRGKR